MWEEVVTVAEKVKTYIELQPTKQNTKPIKQKIMH
jgi:hypothetical protein